MSTRSGQPRRPGTYLLWIATGLGFAYLFVPLFTIARFSFNKPKGNFNIEWQEFTLDNWANAFKSSDYLDAFRESIRIAMVSCVLATVMGAMIAIAISRYRMKGGAALSLVLILPLTTPEIVMGASLFTLFFNQGVDRGFWTTALSHTMFCLSFVALTVKARIRGLDWSLEDAAADLGSTPLRTFRKITLPMVTPGIGAAFLLSLALSIDDYIITSFVAGDIRTFPKEVFNSSNREIPPQVHVIATTVMLVAISVIVLGTLYGNKRKDRAGA